MTAHTDHHATLFLTPGVAGAIESLRRAWDPAMASQIPAHVALAYPREAPIVELLVERVRMASAWVAPFRLRLEKITHAGRPGAFGRGFHELTSDALLDNVVSHRAHRQLGFTEVERAVHYRRPLAAPSG